MNRRRRSAVVAVAIVAAVAAGVSTAAWEATPSGTHLAERVRLRLSGTGQRPTPLRAVAPILVRALIATEDERYYRHHGIDVIGLARAIPFDLTHASFAQGASTLTEQVAKLLYLGGNDHAPWRKLEDMAIAVKLENRYSKAQILDAYLNTAYFGAGAYGIAAASSRSFGSSPRRLTLAQASLLAGLPQAPTADDPLLHPRAARARQVAVLRSLVRTGDISAAQARRVLARPLPLRDTVLPPVTAVDVAPGAMLAWPDAAAGAVLLLLGALLIGIRRRAHRHRLIAGGGAAAVLLLGLAVVLRSFRTL